MPEPLVTAIVSTYAAERYMRGCLEDLVQQTLGERLEILVIDSNSPENEGAIVREFQARHPNIRYLRTDFREDSNGAFNRAIPLARGKYLTNANTDDRHRRDALELQARVLDEHPEFGLVYADSLISTIDNEAFDDASTGLRFDWPDYNHGVGLSCCLFGPHPMWRREVHQKVGLFKPEHPIASDQDMFLAIALQFGAVHLRETLGLFLRRPDSNSGADKRTETIADVIRVLQRYRHEIPLEVLFPALRHHPDDPFARAAANFELGNLCALGPYNDFSMALGSYAAALDQVAQVSAEDPRLARLRLAFANNSACIMACSGMQARAIQILSATIAQGEDGGQLGSNLATITSAEHQGSLPTARQLVFLELLHPVVESSRESRGLSLDHNAALSWSPTRSRAPWEVYHGPDGVPVSEQERSGDRQRLPRQSTTATQHIAIVMFGWADSGGGTILPRQVAKGLRRRGHRVSVFYAGVESRDDLPAYGIGQRLEDGVELFGVFNRPSTFMDLEHPTREIDDPMIRDRFEAFLAASQPDVVHFFNLHNLGMSLATSCRERGIPTLLSSNNYWAICPRLYLAKPDLQLCSGAGNDGSKCAACIGVASADQHQQRIAAAARLLNQQLDHHLAVSQRVRELYLSNGVAADRITVLQQQPESLDHIWREVGSRRQVQTRLDRPLRLGFIGSLLPHKGVHVLAAALQAFTPQQVQATLHGGAPLDYARHIKALDTGDMIHFGGIYQLDQLPALLAKLDVVVVPSIWEDCAPFVVAEALAARVPVIGSNIGGIPDFIVDGENGLLIAADDPSALAQAIARFLQTPELLGQLQTAIGRPAGFTAYLDDLTEIYQQPSRRDCSPTLLASAARSTHRDSTNAPRVASPSPS